MKRLGFNGHGFELIDGFVKELENHMHHRMVLFRIVRVFFLGLLLACLAGCGNDSGTPTQAVVVSDLGNNRVLIYPSPFKADENATVVLGQPDFTHNAANQNVFGSPPGANTLYRPAGIAMGLNGELFVVDQFNCRVLEFDPPFSTNMNATVAFGQPDLLTGNCGFFANSTATASTLGGGPAAVAMDSQGNLWVADGNEISGDAFFSPAGTNSRVLEYVPPFSTGMEASVAIGQASTGASAGCNQGGTATAATLCAPASIAFDSSGNLWVADQFNSRILGYVKPLHGYASGMSATVAIGQASPVSLAFDSSGNLWAADMVNNQVLEYPPPFSTGMTAALAIGQTPPVSVCPSFFDAGQPTGSTLCAPSSISFDSTGNLWVADLDDNRVLEFKPPFTSGMSASEVVLGQPDLTTLAPAPGAPPAANTLGVSLLFRLSGVHGGPSGVFSGVLRMR